MERVPQYIDVEDKIVGIFSWKQLGWFFGAGGVLLLLWFVLEKAAFWIAFVPIILLATAFAFWRPQGVTLLSFIGYMFSFLVRPKLYTWQRATHPPEKKPKEKAPEIHQEKKLILKTDLENISTVLDSHGQARNKRIAQVLKQNMQKK